MRIRTALIGCGLPFSPWIAHHFLALALNACGALRCILEGQEPPDLEPLLASITYASTPPG